MAIPSQSRVVWSDLWSHDTEGPFTLIGKLSEANGLVDRDIASILGEDKMPSYAHRSLLDIESPEKPNERWKPLQDAVARRSLSRICPTFVRHIACDTHMRFCQACMAFGYQSPTCQIQGLSTCLIHDLPLFSYCQHCGASTPPYAVQSRLSLCCHNCGWSWCGTHFGAPLQAKWGRQDDVSRLERLQEWLASLERELVVRWRNLGAWNVQMGDEKGRWDEHMSARAVAIFDTLVHFVPGAPTISSGPPALTFGPFHYSRFEQQFHMPRLGEYEKIAAQLDMLPTEDEKGFAQHFMTPSGGIPLPMDPTVPPEIHARVLWRAQFEGRVGFGPVNRHQVIIDNGMLARLLGVPPSPFWFFTSNHELTMGLLRASKEVALRAAKRWHKLLVVKGACNRPYELLNDYGTLRPELSFWSEWDHHPVGWLRVGNTVQIGPVFYEKVFLTVL
jgi:hypothetical protein